MKLLLIILAALSGLTACSDRKPEDPETDLLAPQREALERAEGVEQALDEAAERQRRLIEEQGG